MTYAAHKRIVISGTFDAGGGVTGEIFSFSLCSSDTLGDQALADAISADIESWFHDARTKIPTWATATELRVESIGTTGLVVSSYGKGLNAQGALGASENTAPALCCYAITLETGARDNRGSKIRGRFYPPNAGFYPGNSPLGAGEGQGAGIAGTGGRLVTALNGDGAVICVASQTDGGANHTVTSISADNIVDTQRRRKNHAIGERGSVSLPYSG